MTTHDEEIAKKIHDLEEEDKHTTEVIEAAKARTHPKPHPTFADPDADHHVEGWAPAPPG